MKIHSLKIQSGFFEEILRDNKRAELRFDDRDFQKGDKLVLLELHPVDKGILTGRSASATITHVLKGFTGLEDDYAILSFQRILDDEPRK